MKSFKFVVAVLTLCIGGFVALAQADLPLVQGVGDAERVAKEEKEDSPPKVEVDLLVESLKASTDNLQKYKMLAALAILLDHSDKIISLREELLRLTEVRLTQLADEIDLLEKEIEEAKTKSVLTDEEIQPLKNIIDGAKVHFVELLDHHEKNKGTIANNKANYSARAVAYNEVMAKTNFCFAEASTLPEGKTAVLPKQFVIR